MKSRNFFKSAMITILALSMFSISSCKKDDDGGSGGGAGEGTIVAKVDGANFESIPMATFAHFTQQQGFSILEFQGSTMDQRAIAINLLGVDGTGTYTIGGTVGSTAIYFELDPEDPYGSMQGWSAPYEGNEVAGEVKISELTDTRVKGTFFFKAKDEEGDGSIVNVTGGSFNIKLTEF